MPLIEPDKKYKLKYNNDLNYIPMPKLKGRQQDLFFAVLSQIKEKKDSQGFLKNFFDKAVITAEKIEKMFGCVILYMPYF